MNIHLAKYSGFCYGVKRAIDMVCSFSDKYSNISTLGPIIHNSAVVEKLLSMGVTSIDDVKDFSGDILIIRSHGISPEVYDVCREKGIEIADATCPYVKKIQRKVALCRQESIRVIIAGQPSHPETVGIIGWAGPDSFVIDSAEEASALPDMEKACIVSQTTMPVDKWNSIVEIVKTKVEQLDSYNSICNATVERQREAYELAEKCDLMFVVGGLNSANTKKLYNICRSICNKVYHIESKRDMPNMDYTKYQDVGIISGASTPDWIIKEVFNTMSDMGKVDVSEEISNGAVDQQQDEGEDINSQEPSDTGYSENEEENDGEMKKEDAAGSSFMEDVDNSMVTIRPGMVMTGKVVSVNENEICVNIGYKSDGIITRSEYSLDSDVNPVDVVNEGDDIEVEVLKVRNEDGNVLLSTKNLEAKKNWKDLMDRYENKESFQGVGKQAVKGGLIATINGVRAFVPASHIDIHYVNDISEYVGKTLDLRIIEVEKHRRRVVASRKAFLLAQEELEKDKLWGQLDEGMTVRGVVRRLTDFGAFVDIGGIDGLIHITDLAWGRVDHPSDVVKINEEIDVIILKVDKDRSRVSLGYKQTKSKPWDIAEDKYPVNSVVSGKVVRIVPFGAFVELEPGLDGLIHISQVSDTRIDKVEDVLQVGQEVEVKVLEINIPAKRISLSIRELMAKGQNADQQDEHGSDNEYYDDNDSVLVDLSNYHSEDEEQ